MGSSYVQYEGFGFWSRDNYISEWLEHLIAEMNKDSERTEWQRQLIAHWELQKDIDGGVMWLGLDEFVSDHRKRDSLKRYCSQAVANCTGFGKRTGELFIQLLDGDLKTNAASPIDYF
jgi:hypothetical protein